MKSGLLVLFLYFCSNINGRKISDCKELIPFTGNIAAYMERILELHKKNVSISQEKIEDFNLRRVMDGVEFYSILEEILLDKNFNLQNVSKECYAAGGKAVDSTYT